jgi:hypothetical protein
MSESKDVVSRVRALLASLGHDHHEVKTRGPHILIGDHARLTDLGHDAYGLSFRAESGGWEPMVLVDTLEELVTDMSAAIAA